MGYINYTPYENDPYKRGRLSTPFGDYELTQGFGKTAFADSSDFYNFHSGIDYTDPKAEVKVMQSGVVDFTGFNKQGWGNQVKVKGDDGREYYYSHLENFNVKPGQRVEIGSIVGKMGSTGNSTGSHIDLSIKENGQWVDPSILLPKLSLQSQKQVTQTNQPKQVVNKSKSILSQFKGIPKKQLLDAVRKEIYNRTKTDNDFKIKLGQYFQTKFPKRFATNKSTTPQGKNLFSQMLGSISQQESTNNYNAIGVPTTSGNRAYGKYQVMDYNIPIWSKEYVGREVSPLEYLRSPEIQEKVAQGQLRKYYDTAVDKGLNPKDAVLYASTSWYAGQGTADKRIEGNTFRYDPSKDTRLQFTQQGTAPSISQYGEDILSRINFDQNG